MRSLLRNSRGVALILTILIVGLIVALTLQFNRTMCTHVESAGNIGHGLKALYAAKSALSYGLAIVMEDSPQVDSLRDGWADCSDISANSQGLFAGGHFELQVEDLSSKIQINRLIDDNIGPKIEKALINFLKLDEFGFDDENVDAIVDAIKDWIDADDDITPFGGAEDDYYRSLERPYHCKNRPLDSPEELLLVKGITPELFYGTEDRPGIAAHISVFGAGKININTADPMVLRSLHQDITRTMAEDMVAYRLDEANDLSDPTWYKNVIGSDLELPDIVTTRSKCFRMTADGYMGDMTRQVVAVVERDDEDLRWLSWKIE
ncbi:MAG: type II secretion system minor pseudopilin GspK [Desulfobacterales bacterium]|nr:type II secretion system minor pseudopilin GspK [Desulfobacterales bacterium]